jgi:hypothetical protein
VYYQRFELLHHDSTDAWVKMIWTWSHFMRLKSHAAIS